MKDTRLPKSLKTDAIRRKREVLSGDALLDDMMMRAGMLSTLSRRPRRTKC
jgi:hypothetical protein